MTQADLQWLRSEMERVIELSEKGTQGLWEEFGPTAIGVYGKHWAHVAFACNPRSDERPNDSLASGELATIHNPRFHEACANIDLIVAAVNYSAAWARHVLRLIERVETENPPLVAERALLSALIADMRRMEESMSVTPNRYAQIHSVMEAVADALDIQQNGIAEDFRKAWTELWDERRALLAEREELLREKKRLDLVIADSLTLIENDDNLWAVGDADIAPNFDSRSAKWMKTPREALDAVLAAKEKE